MKKEMKLVCKILSVFLTVLLVLQIAPMQIIADAYHEATIDENTENTLGVSLDDIDTTEPEAEILAEETSKREQYVKHFRMSDGSYRATQYEVPVHFIQDGEWTDYDNTLTEVDADTEDGESASNKDLTNTLADYSVRLSKKTNGKKFVRIEKDGYKLSWYYTKANKVTAKIIEITDDGDETTLEKLSSQVIYEEVYTDTDFEYIVGSEGLKENIILKSENTQTVFEAEYKANGLTPIQVDDKTIELRADDGTVIYTINAPYMKDANGEYSNGITLTLSSVKNNKFTVTTTLDKDWLDDYDRAYPVTVDPVIETEQNAAKMASAFVASSYPSRNYYSYGQANGGIDSGSMYVGKITGYGQTESYVKFDLPTLGVADKVINAVVGVYLVDCDEGLQVDVKRLLQSWDNDVVTWNNRPTNNTAWQNLPIIDYSVLDDGEPQRWVNFEITELARGWYSGDYANYGISLTTTKTSLSKAYFLNSFFNENQQTKARPILYVDYRNMSGYEDYWSYTGVSAGRSGAVSVNNFNGNAVFSQPITQNDGGNLMPVSISLVYNSNGTTAPYTQLGKNMQTNFHIYLREETNTKLKENGYRYYLNDADGTKHWFYFEKTDSKTGKDEDGLGYTLDLIKDNPDELCDKAYYRITDKSETKMYFDSNGNLMQIRDTNGNCIKVTYDTSPIRIKTITDGAGRTYTFNYGNTSNTSLCTSIIDPAGRVVSFTYDSNALKTITFPDGETYSLTFSGALLTQVGAIDGTRTKITYDSSSQKRVKIINWGISNTNLLESYSFEYKQNETKITDIQNREYTYQFNNLGQTTGIVSNADGQAQYFDYYDTGEAKADSRANRLISESKVLHSVTNYVIDPGFRVNDLETYYDPRIEDTSDAVSITLDTTKGNITDNSVKVYKPETNTGYAHLFQYVKNLDDGEYTLSAYINTEGKTISGGGVYLGYILFDANGNKIGAARAEKIFKTDGWERFSMPFTIKDGQYIRFQVGMQGDSNTPAHGTFWVDDIQVEKSTGMSSYNMLENSDFTNGKNPWSTGATLNTISDLPGFTKAISKVGDPAKTYWGLSQDIFASGKKNDVFSIGAWVKADSAPINNLKDEDEYKPQFALGLLFCDSNGNIKKTETVPLNDDLNTWQFVSGKVIAPVDYERLRFIVIYYNNVNTVMTTGGFCFKEEFGQTYTYDKDGNVVSSVDLANSKSSFAFKGDQMAKMLNPSGSEYFYSYGYDNKNLNTAVSTDGQRYSFTYDSKGNVLTSKIEADKPATAIEDGKYYVIRNAESGNVMDNNSGKGTVHNWRFRNGQGNQIWQAIESDEAGIYYLKSVSHDGHYLAVKDNSNTNNATMTTATSVSGNAFKFKLKANDNGTFTILTKTSNYTKCVDGQPSSSKDYEDGVAIKQCTKNTDDASQQWYFYPDISGQNGTAQQKYISTSATYTSNKNFVASQTDQRGNATTYNYNETTGTLTSVTDASNNTTSYVYNANNNALQSVTSGGMTNSYTYSDDRLTDINVNGGTRYQFTYDSFGRTTYTKVGNGLAYRNLSQLVYNGNGLLAKQEYGNGDYITFSYDNLDRLIGKSYNGSSTDKVEYFYGADGNISKTIDYSTNTRTKYVYDLAGRLVSTRDYKNGYSDHAGLKGYVEYTYADKTNYLTGIKHYNALGTQNIGYRYGDLASGEMPDQIYGVTWNGNEVVDYTYDGLGRLTNKIVGGGVLDDPLNTTYTYVDVDDTKTTTLLKSLSTNGITHNYEYDELGNITSIYDGSEYNTYEYDSLNQLVRENLGYEDVTYTYEYVNGNIKYKHKYNYTTGTLPATPRSTIEYHYEDEVWGDVLTKITETTYSNTSTASASTHSLVGGGVLDAPSTNPLAQSLLGNNYTEVDLTENAIITVGDDDLGVPSSNISTYSISSTTSTLYTIGSDEIGNITNIGNVTMDWNGRRLESISQNGTELISYDYNIDGQRVKKTVNGVTTEYFYNGSILAGQKKGDDVLIFMYDNNGDIFGFTYNGTPYYYVKNAQNDVFLIVDENGYAQVLYQYDAWGVVTACYDATDFGLAIINPIMYRSYYVDLEMDMFVYYLNSRYYIADWGRFASADSYVQTGQGMLDKNMFAYCGNNPVNNIDPTGCLWEYILAVVVIVVVGVIADSCVNSLIDNSEKITGVKVTESEKEFAKEDPVGAVIGFNSRSIANEYQKELYPNTYGKDGNQANAFKHAMWNAVMTDKMGEERAENFAYAHEKEYLETQLALCQMDFHNNYLGRQIALSYPNEDYDFYAQKIKEAIERGDAYVIQWDEGN